MDAHETDVAQALRQSGLVAILRGDFAPERIDELAAALLRGGVRFVEITLNSAGALAAIECLRAGQDADLVVGAGTVRTASDVDDASAAGAQFLVSPNLDPASLERSRRHGVLHLPGVFTPTEAQNARAAGCRMVKLFPCDALGPSYLKALRAPLDDIDFVPTGGVTVDNLGAYVRAGAVAVGLGSSLVTGSWQDPADVTSRARALVKALGAARAEAGSRSDRA